MLRRLLFTFALMVSLTASSAFADPPSTAVREANRAARTAEVAAQRLLHLLGEARRSGDRTGTTCVDGKLSQVNSFGRMIRDRRERLLDAERRHDAAAVAYQRAVLRNLDAQMRVLERAGRACLFEGSEDHGTTVITIIEEEVPDEDPSLTSDEERRRWGRL